MSNQNKPLNLRHPAKRDMTFEIYTGEDGKHYFRLVASNGQTVLQGQGYTERDSLKETLFSVIDAIKDGRYSVKNLA